MAGDAAAKTNPVKMMTLHTVAVDLGAAIGPLLSFIIIDLNGISAVFYLSSMVMLFVGGAWGVFHFFGKKKITILRDRIGFLINKEWRLYDDRSINN